VHFPTELEWDAHNMDGYREHPSDFDLPASDAAPADAVAAAIGSDERRMHVRAYNYWVALLGGRDFPSIEDLEPGDVHDFAEHSVLLDFTCGRDNPAVPYIGAAIREECGLDENVRAIADVPSRSLLSRLTDHYLQIIANRAPIGFEAEYVNQREESICYRGILMPFSSDGEAIDFIYGVINWKNGVEAAGSPAATPEPELTMPEPAAPVEPAINEPFAPLGIADEPVPVPVPAPHLTWEDGPLADAPEIEEDDPIPSVELGAGANLADRLWAARETADAVKTADGRSRVALYRALALAYDFAVAAKEDPADYAELLEESGVKAQARAPMTPITKLVFGIDYDKARLTEFAAALSYAERQGISIGGFQQFIEHHAGGLKGLVAAERVARRPEPQPDTRGETARAILRTAPSFALADLSAAEEFAVIVTRRSADGHHEPIAIIDDEGLIEKAIRKAA